MLLSMHYAYTHIRATLCWASLLALIGLSSCSMSHLYIRALHPAQVPLGEHVRTIGLVNRTKPENVKANVVEGVLTGEGLYEDKSGVASAFGGLHTALHNSPRFEIKQTNLFLPGSGVGNILPAPLPWEEVARICQEYGVDALCAVETYDTDIQIIPGPRLTSGSGNLLQRLEFSANLNAQVKMGLRLYDLQNRTIRDEFRFNHQLGWTSVGASPQAAINALLNKREATDRVSYIMGEIYAARISPSWITLERDYYKKGGRREMKQAYRLAYVNNWNEAAAIWERVEGSSRGKTAGRAAYNLAIAMEVLGRLEEAKTWVSKSYATYGNKKAREYNRLLERRIQNNLRLENQLPNYSLDTN